jgi:hypothetical protein
MTPSREKWKLVQAIIGTAEDGFPGPNDERALEELRDAARTAAHLESEWTYGLASSFADPADIRAFKRCKAQGKSDQECFKVGDNGIGKWGADTTLTTPMCALPPEDWRHLPSPAGTLVRVVVDDREVLCELQDTMPARANIHNRAIIDLNEAAWRALRRVPPVLEPAKWRWA